jgi:hypothetical protein
MDIGPFKGVASLAGLLVDTTEKVQVRALADGSVNIITSQSILWWIDHEWQVTIVGEGTLPLIDDDGQLWVLNQDTGEFSVWQGEQWITYAADSGWTDVGSFEQNWWAPAPWSVQRGADGRLWVPMAQDVRAFDGNRWIPYTLEDMEFPIPEIEDIDIVHNLAVAQGGKEVWVGECYYSGPGPMGGGGVRWFDGQAWHGVDAPVGSTCVFTLYVDPVGNVWLGAYNSIWRYEHDSQSWTEYSLPEALLSDFNFSHPRQIIIDQVGDVWVGMQMCGGASCDSSANLYRIHDGEWSLIIDAAYWGSSFKQLALDGNGQAWLFWEGMVYQLDDQPLEPYAQIEARGVGVSPEGGIWVVAGSGEEASLLVLEP